LGNDLKCGFEIVAAFAGQNIVQNASSHQSQKSEEQKPAPSDFNEESRVFLETVLEESAERIPLGFDWGGSVHREIQIGNNPRGNLVY
jgi:hypothetical protein